MWVCKGNGGKLAHDYPNRQQASEKQQKLQVQNARAAKALGRRCGSRQGEEKDEKAGDNKEDRTGGYLPIHHRERTFTCMNRMSENGCAVCANTEMQEQRQRPRVERGEAGAWSDTTIAKGASQQGSGWRMPCGN